MILGIDTSNYTTSVAVVSAEQQLLFDQRKVLYVSAGERGLQQSTALFLHVQNLPELIKAVLVLHRKAITGICCSIKPRPLENSYMPVFRAGEGFAQTLAAALDVPLFASTHQEGHIAAGLWSAGFKPTGPFLAIHISGGTTDLLKVEPGVSGFQIETLGSSSDLHAGQFVDRIGVKLGMSFPAGKDMEEMVQMCRHDLRQEITFPSSVRGYEVSFSGPCSAAERAVDAGIAPAEVCSAVFRCIANSMVKILLKAIRETGLKEILIVGGVGANSFIKVRLCQHFTRHTQNVNLYFAEPQYSRDNAVGTALLGLKLKLN